MAEQVPFETIAAGLEDVAARGTQIIAEHDAMQLPFGSELLTETPDNAVRLGSLACIKRDKTEVDDSIVIGTTGADNMAGVASFESAGGVTQLN